MTPAGYAPTSSSRARTASPVADANRAVILQLRCPACHRKVRDAALSAAGTVATRRTCSTGHAWRVELAPLSFGTAGHLHLLTWQPLAREAA